MPELDPSDHTVRELKDALEDVDSANALQNILEAERDGKDRKTAKQAIERRLDEVGGERSVLAPEDHTVNELEDAVQDIDSASDLEDILKAERDGKDRKTAKEAIERRLDEVGGGGEAEDGDEPEPDDADAEDGGAEEEEFDDPLEDDEEDPLDRPTEDKQYISELEDGVYRDMWVYCETHQGELLDVSKEMLGKARELMDQYEEDYGDEERVVAVLVGDGMEELAEETIMYGADVAVYLNEPRLERFLHRPYTEVVANMMRADAEWREYDEPRYVLFPATNNGRDLSAMVQAELDSGLASDCSDLYIEPHEETNPMKTGVRGETKTFERTLHMKRPDFSGFEYSTILCLDNPDRDFHPQGASVIPGTFPVPEQKEREGIVVEYDGDLEDSWFDVEIVEHDSIDEGVDLTGHDVVVALGRGIGDSPTEGIELGLELRDAFDDAALGVTRGIVTASYDFDASIEEYTREERQIGETGQVVEPELYIAAGISGAIQHKVGMDESETIVAVNTDPDARIRDFSDYFVQGDLFEVLPRLTEAVEEGDVEAALAGGGD